MTKQPLPKNIIIWNEDIQELTLEAPEGHQHLRATMIMEDGMKLIFREATVANLVRAYITLETHPVTGKVRLRGKRLSRPKEGYAEWQPLEVKNQETEGDEI